MSKTPEPVSSTPAWFGFAQKDRYESGRVRLRFRWGRIGSAALILAVVGWLSWATAFYFFFKEYRKFEEVRFSQMLIFPLNLPEIRKQMGNADVEQGIQKWKEQKWGEATHLLRVGVARAPENLEGRMHLAQYYYYVQRPDLTIKLLEDGLQYVDEENTDYMKLYLRFLLDRREDKKIREVAAQYLSDEPEVKPFNQLIANAAAHANLYRGSFDEAEKLLADYQLINSIQGIILSSRIDWSRGDRQSAIDKLEAFATAYSNADLDEVYATLSQYYRETGNAASALRYAVLRTTQNPLDAQPRLQVLYAYDRSGEDEKVDREVRAIIDEFRNDEAAIQGLANFAADSGDIELARRTYEMALENDFSIPVFGLLFIEAHVVAGNYSGAARFCEELVKENPSWLQDYLGTFNSLRSVAYFGMGREELGELYLDKFLQWPHLRAQTLLPVARRYREIGRLEEARTIMERAYELDPTNQVALSNIIEMDLELGDSRQLTQRIQKLLQLRRPSYDLIERAYNELSSDRFLFAENRDSILIDLAKVLKETNRLSEQGGERAAS